VAEGFEMQPKDVVYVDANGVVRWSRVMSMLIQPITGTAGFMRY